MYFSQIAFYFLGFYLKTFKKIFKTVIKHMSCVLAMF